MADTGGRVRFGRRPSTTLRLMPAVPFDSVMPEVRRTSGREGDSEKSAERSMPTTVRTSRYLTSETYPQRAV